MKEDEKQYLYEIDNPIKFSDWNEYFVRFVRERDDKYFAHFLCRYEPKLDSIAWKFIKQYDIGRDRLHDLKQLFSAIVWTKMQAYNPDCGLPFLQLLKYDVARVWHEYVRTSCGITSISSEHIYYLIRKSANLFFAEDNPNDGLNVVVETLDMAEDKAVQMIISAKQFKYSDRIALDDSDGNKFRIDFVHEYELPPSMSAEDDYLSVEQRIKLMEAATKLSPKEVQIIEMTVGVCLTCLGLLPKKTYEQVALLQGAADASVIEKKRKKALAKLRNFLL